MSVYTTLASRNGRCYDKDAINPTLIRIRILCWSLSGDTDDDDDGEDGEEGRGWKSGYGS